MSQLDLAYVREHPETIDRLVKHQRIRETPVPGGDVCAAQRLTLDDGTDLFTKTRAGAPPDFFTVEATALRWLAEPGVVALPEVVAASVQRLVLSWVEPGPPTVPMMASFGQALAALHASGAPSFGASWAGYLGRQRLDNTPGEDWPAFYVERRLLPYLRAAVDRGDLGGSDLAAVERAIARVAELAGPDERPARIHGDLWGGNVLPARDGQAYLVDPAAHGGHRETDLAMLALFGAPYLDTVLAAYDEAFPLADGWRERVPLHQLHPLLVHAASHGPSYAAAAAAAARRLT